MISLQQLIGSNDSPEPMFIYWDDLWSTVQFPVSIWTKNIWNGVTDTLHWFAEMAKNPKNHIAFDGIGIMPWRADLIGVQYLFLVRTQKNPGPVATKPIAADSSRQAEMSTDSSN